MHLIPFHGRNRRTAEKKKKSRRSRRGQEEADMMLDFPGGVGIQSSLAVTTLLPPCFHTRNLQKGKAEWTYTVARGTDAGHWQLSRCSISRDAQETVMIQIYKLLLIFARLWLIGMYFYRTYLQVSLRLVGWSIKLCFHM
jgi:hypothetical protein